MPGIIPTIFESTRIPELILIFHITYKEIPCIFRLHINLHNLLLDMSSQRSYCILETSGKMNERRQT